MFPAASASAVASVLVPLVPLLVLLLRRRYICREAFKHKRDTAANDHNARKHLIVLKFCAARNISRQISGVRHVHSMVFASLSVSPFFFEHHDTAKEDGWYDYDESGAMVVEQLYTE